MDRFDSLGNASTPEAGPSTSKCSTGWSICPGRGVLDLSGPTSDSNCEADEADVHTQQRLGTIAKDASKAASIAGDAVEEGYKWYLGGKILGAIVGVFRAAPFTSATVRTNLIKLTGRDPGADAIAHHGLPQEFEVQFGQLGIRNIHDPRWGMWVGRAQHESKEWHEAYNKIWRSYLSANPTPQQIERFWRLQKSKINEP